MPALEKVYVRLAAVRAPEGNLDDRCLTQTYETVTSFRKISLGSNRKLGLAFGVLLAILGLWPLFHRAGSPNWGRIALFTAILAVALLRPYWLMPLKRGWFKLGLALNRIAGPCHGDFFRSSRPAWLYLCRKGEDLLRLKGNSQGRTSWIEREPLSPAPDSMKIQF